jgi:flagellin-like protein
MHRFRRSERGLSEIVGTLLLVLIVVAAATALAAFVAGYQKQLQQKQSFTHDQSLESLHILGLSVLLNANRTQFTNFSFTLASEYVNPSIILGISINNYPLVSFSWKNLSSNAWFTNVLPEQLTLAPLQEIFVSTNLNNGFLSPSAIPLPNQYIKFDIYTELQNDFTRIFLPPVALGVVSETNPSAGGNMTLLDGSTSFQPGGNASIVQWNWLVSGGGLPTNHTLTFQGEECEVSPALPALTGTQLPYAIVLTVTSSDGLLGTVDLSYTPPGST